MLVSFGSSLSPCPLVKQPLGHMEDTGNRDRKSAELGQVSHNEGFVFGCDHTIDQELLCNAWDPVQNKNSRLLVQKFLRILRWRERSPQPNGGYL